MLSNLFYTINFSITIVSSIISFILCLSIILLVITHRQCRTVSNALICNTCVAVAMYSIFRVIESIYGMRQDWQSYEPACIFRAYCTLALCGSFCYSYSIQAISRLFFAVLYKHRFLLTWHTHWILIIINWLISSLASIRPFFFSNGFGLEIESRICVVTPKTKTISLYVIVIMFLIPLNTVVIVYVIILYHVRRSTRRIGAIQSKMNPDITQSQIYVSNGKRELKLMQNMSIQSSIISLGGILYLVVVMWHATRQNPPPESFYLLSLNFISVFTTFMVIALFLMNKPVKDIAMKYIFCSSTLNIDRTINLRPTPRGTM